MNILTINVIIIIAVCAVIGAARGFVKAALGVLFSVIALIAAYLLVPLVGAFIINNTGVDEYIEAKVKDRIEKEIVELPVNPNKNEQIDIIKRLGFTESFTDSLLENNNEDAKKLIGAVDFYDYISKYIARRTVNLIAYVITFACLSILFAVINIIMKLAVKLPVLKGLNRLGGAIFGGVLGLIIVWVLFIFVAYMPEKDICVKAMEQIEESGFLSFIYDNNLLVNMIDNLK
ncbi:MAG: CvpA family protein [Lachnospiraceae bacterium]|nr:CvpA family protein [Lachnospiraceae bacterium]